MLAFFVIGDIYYFVKGSFCMGLVMIVLGFAVSDLEVNQENDR